MALAKDVYQATTAFPDNEKFGLISQMRRAAVSIPSNLAEGHARSSTAELRQFVSIALGSVTELETQVLLSADLGYLQTDAKQNLLTRLDVIDKMLYGLRKALACRMNATQNK